MSTHLEPAEPWAVVCIDTFEDPLTPDQKWEQTVDELTTIIVKLRAALEAIATSGNLADARDIAGRALGKASL